MQRKLDYDIEGALQAGITEVDISKYLKSKGHSDADIKGLFSRTPSFSDVQSSSSTYQAPVKKEEKTSLYKSIFPSYGKEFEKAAAGPEKYIATLPEDTMARAIPQARLGASVTSAIAATMLSGGASIPAIASRAGLIGDIVGTSVDQGLRTATKEGTGSLIGLNSPVAAGIEDIVLGKLASRTAKTVAGAAGEIIKPGYAVGDRAARLKSTLSGYFEKAPKIQKIEETSALTQAYNKSRKEEVRKLAEEEIKNFAETEFGSRGFPKTTYELDVDSPFGSQLGKIIDNPKQLDLALTTRMLPGGKVQIHNMRQGLASFNLKKQQVRAAVPIGNGEYALNGQLMVNDLMAPENANKFKVLYGANNTQQYKDFFNEMARNTRPDGVFSNSFMHNIMRYGTFALGTGLSSYMLSGSAGKAALASGTGLMGVYALGKGTKASLSALFNNATTARIMAGAVKGGPIGMSNDLASRIIGRALVGHTVNAVFNDDTEIKGVVNKDGQIDPTP